MVIPDKGLTPKPNDWAYATPFMNLLQRGKKPCIVLESRAKDEDYLRSRGITELIPVKDAANRRGNCASVRFRATPVPYGAG